MEDIARRNNTTPMAIYGIMRSYTLPVSTRDAELSSAEDIEAKFSGKGLGRKTLAEVCRESGVDLQVALDRLSRAGISAKGEDKVRSVAEEYDRKPVDLLGLMLTP